MLHSQPLFTYIPKKVMRFQSYFNTAVQLIKAYTGSIPLAHYLKNYFAQHKKHGSKDRKYIAHLCYCYYRIGHALKDLSVEDRLKAALFVCNASIAEWGVLYDEFWQVSHSTELTDRISFLYQLHGFTTQQIFPWQAALSEGIDWAAFAQSHLVQPDLFLRIRPGKKHIVIEKLKANNLQYTEIDESSLALPNNSQVDKIIALDKEAVVQDYSSQQISSFLRLIQQETNTQQPVTNLWDCCAASGGKAILAYDTIQNIQLTVSDIRASIISNLENRFAEAGIKNYKSFVADLTNSRFTSHDSRFDLVLCDAPCSGSGTWGRTPEQLYFFTEETINHYAALQQKIVRTALPYVKQGGWFLYITCSVFAKENEVAVEGIVQQGFTLVKKGILTGYDKKADTMFAALLQKQTS